MNGPQRGFLLLTSHLGDPTRKVLTVAQFRTLATRVRQMSREAGNRDLEEQDLVRLGYSREMAHQILELMNQEDLLQWYLTRGRREDCEPIARVSETYPLRVRKRLGLDAPGCLWAKGNLELLQLPMVSLVGSRELREENRTFARECGRQAALQGYALVSGNARGADREAQDACLAAGGRVISVVADALQSHPEDPNVLWLSEDGFDLEFTNQRALSRNRVIHSLGQLTLVAQCDLGKGGTWDGTTKNLRHDWSPVCCFADGSKASGELEAMGSTLVDMDDLRDFAKLENNDIRLIDR